MGKRAKEILPYRKHYPRDFLHDPLVEVMTTAQVGAHSLLIDRSWFETPGGSVPDNPLTLARWTHCLSVAEWDSIKGGVMKAWELRGDRWFQKRAEKEFKEARRRQKMFSEVATDEWKKRKAKGDAKADAIALPQHSNGNATQTHTHNPDEFKPNGVGVGGGAALAGAGGGGGSGNLGAAFTREQQLAMLSRTESQIDSAKESISLLENYGVRPGTVRKLMAVPGVTPDRIRCEMKNVEESEGVKSKPATLAYRLGYRPKRAR